MKELLTFHIAVQIPALDFPSESPERVLSMLPVALLIIGICFHQTRFSNSCIALDIFRNENFDLILYLTEDYELQEQLHHGHQQFSQA